MGIHSIASPWAWLAFLALVVALVALDLGVLHRRSHQVTFREAALFSLGWVALSAVFGVGIYVQAGPRSALEFTTGYVLEKALAVDNLFVFALIFQHLKLPPRYQPRVLVWGILGAMLLRAVFIVAGSAFVARFSWALYVFGAILLILGVRLVLSSEAAVNPEGSWLLRQLRRFLPTTAQVHGRDFLAREEGRWRATPLFVALIAVELSDVLFALDSLPAIFAVTQDPFIVFTSNILAVLGLRALYFLLAGLLERFHYLRYGLSVVLCLIGVKLLAKDLFEPPIVVTLLVTVLVLALAVLISWFKEPPAGASRPQAG